MKPKEQANIIFENAEQKFAATKTLFRNGHYLECLFFCHLSLELYLKSIVVLSTKQPPPFIHDLRRLAEIAGLPLDQEVVVGLEQVNDFNIRARYDDYKRRMYKQATKPFTQRQLETTTSIVLWLKNNTQLGK